MRTPRTLVALSLALVVCAMVFAQALAQMGPVTHTDIERVISRIADADGVAISGESAADTLLYTSMSLEHQPVLAPDGSHLTLGEFQAVDGSAVVWCGDRGTHLALDLSGLVPDGVYTMWAVVFAEPGFDGTMDNRAGGGKYSHPDAELNTFMAASDGSARVSMLLPASNLSAFPYDVGGCLLSDEYEVHLVGAYHIDGLTHGSTPGPAGSEAFQFAFIFQDGQPVRIEDLLSGR